MTIDVFISYSHADKATADAACAMLEGSGVRCWIAPRDVPPGSQWAGAIISAIDHCRVMVLIFSAQANISNQIHREVERAINKGIPVIPLRIEEVNPTNSMEYYLGAIHWLDALTPPLEEHLQRLTATVKSCLDVNQAGDDLPARSDTAKLAAVGPNAVSTTPSPPQRMRDGSSHQDRAASNWGTAARWAALGALCLLIAAGGGAVLYHFEYAQGTKHNPAAEVAVPPLQQQSAAVRVDQPNVAPPVEPPPAATSLDQLTKITSPAQRIAFDEVAVRQLAGRQKIPLPATLIVNVPSPTAPARFADYLGAWGGDEGWGGAGRHAILVVEEIDETGKATGVFAQGPPTASSPIRVAASFSTFTAPVTNDGLTFTRGQLTFTFKRAPGNLMLGHSQGKVDQQPVEFAITLQPISQVEQQRAVAPVDTPRPSSKTVEPRSFDGQWEVNGNGGPSCPIKSWKKVLDISGHEIRMPGGSPGEISSDGNFQFTSTSPINPAITVSYTGKLQDDAGSGTYKTIGGSCAGSIALTRR